MTTLGGWLDARAPAAPAELAARLRGRLDASATEATIIADLGEAARASLVHARTGPSSDRDRAFDLLLADALLTYACEAALDEEDVEASLSRILRIGAVP